MIPRSTLPAASSGPHRFRGAVLLALLGKLLLSAALLVVATPVLVLFVAGRCDC